MSRLDLICRFANMFVVVGLNLGCTVFTVESHPIGILHTICE